jgi:DNA-binding response OmpR family regulator
MNHSPAEEHNYAVVLDDDPMVSQVIEKILDMPVRAFFSASDLRKSIGELQPFAAFVDIHLSPEESGLDMLGELRSSWNHCPLVVITADNAEDHIKTALSRGADDFISKPIRPKELESRVNLRLKDFATKNSADIFQLHDLTVDRLRRVVKSDKGVRYVTPMDINILTVLKKNLGKQVRREDLKTECWGNISVTDNALNRKLHEIRGVVKDLSTKFEIKTIYGVGFTVAETK